MAYIRKVDIGKVITLSSYDLYYNYFRSCKFTSLVQPTYDDANKIITFRINDDAELVLYYTLSGHIEQIFLDGTAVSTTYQLDSRSNSTLVVCSDNVFYFKIRGYDGVRFNEFHYLYEIIDTGTRTTAYNGWYSESTTSGTNTSWEHLKLNTIKLFQRGLPEEERIYYAHSSWEGDATNPDYFRPMLNYNTFYKSIDYATSYFIQNTNITNIEDTNFLTCSYKSIDSIVSFEGVNYYVVDPYTLIEIDIEDEEEDEEE